MMIYTKIGQFHVLNNLVGCVGIKTYQVLGVWSRPSQLWGWDQVRSVFTCNRRWCWPLLMDCSHWMKLVCTEASMPFNVWVCFLMSIGLIDGCPPQNIHCSISVFSTLWFELKRIQGDWEVQHQNGAQPRPWADSEPHRGVSEEALEQEMQPEQDERDGGGGEGLVGRYQHS